MFMEQQNLSISRLWIRQFWGHKSGIKSKRNLDSTQYSRIVHNIFNTTPRSREPGLRLICNWRHSHWPPYRSIRDAIFPSNRLNVHRLISLIPTCCDFVMEFVTIGNKVAIRAIMPQNRRDSKKRKQQCVILTVTVKRNNIAVHE